MAGSWIVKTMTGFRISHPYIAVDPACPDGRHPTRDCGCKVFKTRDEADAYVETKRKKTP